MKTKIQRLTKRAYASLFGTVCPECHSVDVCTTGRLKEAEDGNIYKPMACRDCGARWREIWVLKGYEQ